MGKLVYLMNVSLDGYVEGPDHALDWSVADDETHAWFAEQERSFDASLYGRRLYETMAAYWPTSESDPTATEAMREFGRVWRAKPIVVFSSTLESVGPNSRLARGDIGDELAAIRTEFAGDLNVGGATLAASFIQRGLVDEFRVLVHPVILGAGTPYLPPLDQPLRLELTDTHRFASGVVYVAYRRA